MSESPRSPQVAPPPVVKTSVLPGAGLSLALLLAINLFNYIDRYILAAVEPYIAREFFEPGDPDESFWMGLLPTAFLLSYMITAPIFGWMADRMSRWVIISGGVILWSLATGGSGLAVGFGMLLVTRLFLGIGEAAYGPAAPTLISDLYPVEKRGRRLSLFYLAIPVGSALGFVLGGQIAAYFGTWRAPFYCMVLPGIVLGLLCFMRREPARGRADVGGEVVRRAKLSEYLILAKTPAYIFNTLGMTAMTFAVGGMAFWMPRYVGVYRMGLDLGTDEGRQAFAHVTMTFGATTVVAGFLGTIAGGWLGDRLRARMPGSYLTISGIGMLMGFPLVVAMFYTPFPAAWVLIFLAEFCLFFNTGPTNTVLANVTHPAMRATGFAVNILIIHLLGDVISPPLMGWIAGPTQNWNAAFLAVAIAFLVSGVFWLVGARWLERDTALASVRLEMAR